jgi:hypothetical protein
MRSSMRLRFSPADVLSRGFRVGAGGASVFFFFMLRGFGPKGPLFFFGLGSGPGAEALSFAASSAEGASAFCSAWFAFG